MSSASSTLKLAIPALLCLAACPMTVHAQSPTLPGWRLVWADEFPGGAFDAAKWNAENVAWPYNNELEFYLPQQATVSNGLLNIKAERRTVGGRNFVSARLNTSGKFSQQYGRFEARIKVPGGLGYWPAFWVLPITQGWPPEIDIMETIGSLPNTVYMTHHFGTASNLMSNGTTWAGPDFTAGYHRYAVEWSPNRIDWLVDGVVRFTSTGNIPREPMYVLLNLAIGGTLPGNPTAATVFPQSMLVDWVRVYARETALTNPGFEDATSGNITGWQAFGNTQQSATTPHSGSKSVRVTGIAGNGPYYAGVFQDLPASPGQSWTATAFARHNAADRLLAGNYVDLKIEWYDANGQQIGVNQTMAINNASPTATQLPSSVQSVAPAGTASARVALVFVQTGTGAGAAYLDDVTFAYTSPPAILTCAADFNGQGGISVQDIFDFLAAYFANDPRADFSGNGGLSVQDIFDFLASYFSGCTN